MNTEPMNTDTRYNMTGCGRSYLGERNSFAEAERLARWHAARRDIRVPMHRHRLIMNKRRTITHGADIEQLHLGRSAGMIIRKVTDTLEDGSQVFVVQPFPSHFAGMLSGGCITLHALNEASAYLLVKELARVIRTYTVNDPHVEE